jgi:c(7)-type cytochrome triheme protein
MKTTYTTLSFSALIAAVVLFAAQGWCAQPGVSNANVFNRLLKPIKYNQPPAEDGYHDPGAEDIQDLQAPLQAFQNLPKSAAGNRVDWVKALDEKKISPRWDRNDPNAQAMAMDLDIVFEVKGFTPDVVYPHRQHTLILDCTNCHTAIFVPQKGANQISMAAIMAGEKCGVCHGSVAFPISECRRCHTKKKTVATKKGPAAGSVKP